DVPKAARVHTAQAATTAKGKAAVTKAVANTLKAKSPSLNLPEKKSGVYSQLEVENEMLKQQVANLSAQVEKLRAALSTLA
ncbi:MAG: hypothetical protein IJ859_10950, partial [Synergistaceae bacterium]|nr:hypothetical protein [Synergistaceae bacterium]